jgi:hypothetical protein
MEALAESTFAGTRTDLLNGKRPLTGQAVGGMDGVPMDKNEPYDIRSTSFPWQTT